MAIFPDLNLEPVVQVNDRTRLDGTGSFVTQDEGAVTGVFIKATSGEDYINVTTDRFLDWSYSASGTETVSIIVSTAAASAEFTKEISVVTAEQDRLFSNDSDLKLHEPDIIKWTEDGRNSFINTHRRAKKILMENLRLDGYVDVYGDPYTEAAIIDIEEVKQWATFITLRLIFEGISNSTEDVFHVKAKRYSELEIKWRSAALLRLDIDGDGTTTEGEGIDTRNCFVARR